jgi:mono/diheme cytochrome c family protein
MTWRVIVGTLSLMVTMIVLGFVAVTEQDRMASFTRAYESRRIEVGAAIFENNCSRCHGLDGKGSGMAPALNAADLLSPDSPRLKEIGWAGTTDDYVRGVISGGRPRPSAFYADLGYPERMPTWGAQFGGPLRTDQVEALVAYIMNWASDYANATPQAVPTVVPVGTDITVALPAGDAANGEKLAKSVGCAACHIDLAGTGAPLIGPAWLPAADPTGKGIGARAEERYKEAGYAGKATSPEQYLFESIVDPNVHIVEGDYKLPDGTSKMPKIYSTSLDQQMVADIIAYLLTLK